MKLGYVLKAFRYGKIHHLIRLKPHRTYRNAFSATYARLFRTPLAHRFRQHEDSRNGLGGRGVKPAHRLTHHRASGYNLAGVLRKAACRLYYRTDSGSYLDKIIASYIVRLILLQTYIKNLILRKFCIVKIVFL